MNQSEHDAFLLSNIQRAAKSLNNHIAMAESFGLRVEMHTVSLETESGSIEQYYFNAYRRIEVEEDLADVPRQPNDPT